MRIGTAGIIVFVAGVFFSAHRLIGDRTLSPVQRANVAGCSECHSEDRPLYDSGLAVHGKHVDLECTQCHIQLPNVAGCAECHSSGVPTYNAARRLHRNHAALNCSGCHGDSDDLRVSGNLHKMLERLGGGTILFALTGIIANLFIVTRRGRGN